MWRPQCHLALLFLKSLWCILFWKKKWDKWFKVLYSVLRVRNDNFTCHQFHYSFAFDIRIVCAFLFFHSTADNIFLRSGRNENNLLFSTHSQAKRLSETNKWRQICLLNFDLINGCKFVWMIIFLLNVSFWKNVSFLLRLGPLIIPKVIYRLKVI